MNTAETGYGHESAGSSAHRHRQIVKLLGSHVGADFRPSVCSSAAAPLTVTDSRRLRMQRDIYAHCVIGDTTIRLRVRV